ncbi:MAG: GDP-mannose 4,6-dehydratase [Deltaproteobacteria bacterium]|nr:GDP-mannose 4,6-dehydratase [Deltaproteobacteria bacterium]
MKVLVTGAAGFIGSHVAEALLHRGDEVVGVDNFNAFYDPAIKEANIDEVRASARAWGRAEAFRLVRADIVHDDLSSLFTPENCPDVVCHLAAWAGVRPSIVNPLIYQSVNVEGTLKLLELARHHGVKPFVFASSSSVYGARREVPFREDDRVDDPISPYAATKKAGELIGYTYHHLHGLRFFGLRFFTVYGPRQRPEMAIHLFARAILDGKPIRMHGDGESSRDYTYIDDCVQGVVAAIDRSTRVEDKDGYRIYNLGCSDTTSLRGLVSTIEAALGKKAQIEHAPDQPGDVPLTFADIRRARAELGYDPKTPIPDGVPKFVEWLKKRRGESN